MNLANWAT